MDDDQADRRAAQEIYDALGRRDAAALQRLLDPECEGEVTAGLPAGIGGLYRGREAVLGMWGRVARLFDIRPEPAEYLSTADGRLLVLGRYRGQARATGREVDAAFAHVLTVRGGRLQRLVQITDSQRWSDALEQAESLSS
jgi:ketosteroid isomerase-like protein